MFNRLSLLFLALIFLISGCDSSSTDTQSTGKAFDLATAQQQYANIELTIADIGEQNYQNGSALAVTLSTPLNPSENFQYFFNVSHKADKVKGSWELSNSGLVVYFPHIEPAQSYMVDVIGGLTAATGKKLVKTVSNTVETRNREPQLRFASKGSVLPATLAKGLPIVTTNVKAATVDFYRVKSDQTHDFLSKWEGSSQQSSYSLEKYQSAVDLVYTGRFDFNPPKNKHFNTHLDLKSIDELQTAGIYLAVMKQVGNFKAEFQVTYFVVSDLGLHARLYHDKIAVQISALATGKAISGVNVTLYNKADKELSKTKTDSEGQAHFSTHQEASYLLARDGDHLSVLKLNAPALDLSEFNIEGREQKPIELFIYSPRNLYRPGETITFSTILRNADAQLLQSPPIKAVIKRADGQKIKYFTWHPHLKEKGYYQTEYTLPETAMTGDWVLELTIADKITHHYKFKVEDFLPERMELLLGKQPAVDNWTDRDSALTIPVSGRYLYGVPAAQNRLNSKIRIKKNRQPIKRLKGYYFGLEDEKFNTRLEELGEIRLDAKGQANLTVNSVWSDVKNTPMAIKVISSLFETGGRPVTRSIDYTSWPQKTLIGIRPQIALSDIPDSSEISFDIVKSTSKGTLQGNTEVVAKLIKEQRDYYWEYSNSQGWHSEYTDKSYPVFEKRFDLKAKKAVTLKVPVEWGAYLLLIEDGVTGQQSSVRFYAGSGWDKQANNQSARPDRIVLELDKKSYLAEETVKVKITPPYSGNGFISVENGDEQLWFKRLDLLAKGNVVEIPIKKEWAQHDLYISAVAFKAGDSKQKITPNRAVGIIHLPLNRAARQLKVSLDAPQTTIRPETTLQTGIKITGAVAGQKTYVTLAAVDVGVLNITNYKTPNPFEWFFEPRRYTVDQRDIYNKIIELVDGGVTKARFGGDADNDKHAGGARPDSKLKIVSLFSGVVETDAQGMAKIDLKIPDFNGRLRLMAVAFNDHQFGAAETNVTVSAPVIAEVSLPRFLAAGDQAELTVDIRNQSGETQQLTLNFSSTSPVTLINNSPLTVVLKDKQKQVIRLPIVAENAFGQSRIQLQLKNTSNATETIDLKRQWFLGVRPAYPAKSSVQRRIIHQGEPVQVHTQMVGLFVNSATAQLNISSQPPIAIKSHLKQLLQYPYGCLEQTISRTYPWLSLTEATAKTWGLEKLQIRQKPIKIQHKKTYIDRGISRLAGMQRSNGSFGLWSNNDREEYWLTAYAVDFLLDAKDQGANVPQEMLEKALKRLGEYINQRSSRYGRAYTQDIKHTNFAYKSYAAYVLSRVNQVSLGSLRTLFKHHHKEAKSALPLTHLGIALFNQGDKVKGEQAILMGLNKSRNDRLYLGDYGSQLRDTSVITYLLNKYSMLPKRASGLIFSLSDKLGNRDYLSTQERNALFRTGVLLQGKPQATWQGQLIVGDNEVGEPIKQTGTYRKNFQSDTIPTTIHFSSQTNAPLYMRYQRQAYPTESPATQMDLMQIERSYYNLQGQSIVLNHIQSGQVVLVHLTITAHQQRFKDALVVDLIPAGFEIENQNLEHNLKIESFKIGTLSIQQLQENSHVKYQQYLGDRYIAAMDLHKNKPQHAFYLMRAVTKGVFINPPPYAEDMYRPYMRGIGRTFNPVRIF